MKVQGHVNYLMFEFFHASAYCRSTLDVADIRETLSLYCGRSILKRIARLYYSLRIYPSYIYLIPRGIIRDKMRFTLTYQIGICYEYSITYRDITISKIVDISRSRYLHHTNIVTSTLIKTRYIIGEYNILKSLNYHSDGTYHYSIDIESPHNKKLDIYWKSDRVTLSMIQYTGNYYKSNYKIISCHAVNLYNYTN